MNKIIAIDGPTASGKGTIAKRIAKYFNIPYLWVFFKMHQKMSKKWIKKRKNEQSINIQKENQRKKGSKRVKKGKWRIQNLQN